MNQKLNIEELISQRLGEAEITPSQGLWHSVRQQLRRKQFFRFNPGQLNIYYLAGLLLVGTGLVFQLTNDGQEGAVREGPGIGTPGYQQGISDQQEGYAVEGAVPVEGEMRVGGADSKSQPFEPDQKGSTPADALSREIPEGNSEDGAFPSEDSLLSGQEKELEVPVTMVPYFTSSARAGCAPLTIQFYNQSVNAAKSYWTIGQDTRTDEWDPAVTFDHPGRYTVTLIAEDAAGQAGTYQQVIDVYQPPRVSFEIEEGLEGIDNHVVLNIVNYSEEAVSFTWNLLDRNNLVTGEWSSDAFQPSIKLTDLQQTTMQLRLVASSEFGCIDTSIETIPIVVESSKTRIRFPNAFSPSPFGPSGGTFSPYEKRTDLFHPLVIEEPLEYTLRIYTRRGELVFESREIYQGWDGYIQQERALGGVYVWMVEGIWEGGEEFKLHGDVTLIWKEIW